jgi:hypothetical protein
VTRERRSISANVHECEGLVQAWRQVDRLTVGSGRIV